MIRYWKMLLSMFTRGEQFQIYLLLVSTSILGLIEVAGIASIMPFIAVVVDPSMIDTNEYLNQIYKALGFTTPKQFLIFLGSLAFIMLIVSNSFAALDAWFTFRFCHLREHMLCKRLLGKYLRQEYRFFLQRNTADLSKIILSQVERVIVGTLMAGIGVFSDLVATLFILGLLFVIDPWVTVSTLLILGSAYTIIFLLIQKKVMLLGEEFVALGTQIVQRTREALEGIKEIKVLGRETQFIKRYAEPHYQSSINSISYNTLDIIPQQALELVAFGGIISMTLYFVTTADNAGEVLPVIALYAFAAYRLIPMLKEIFDGIERIRYNAAALEEVWRDFTDQAPELSETLARVQPMGLKQSIQVRNVTYQYPGAHKSAVENLSFAIPAHVMTCLIGPTGAGKSTAIELILGLLVPDHGQISVDGVAISSANLRRWQSSIGYVPQVIYLINDTIANNIALGIPENEIDYARVQAVAELADIHGFITEELNEGYATVVGERGLRLSGGQRQRVGIARALYHDPEVLILDEATNALDRVTESRLMDRLLALEPKKTIIFVSHKASIAARCDHILVLAQGRLIGQGTYAELMATDLYFRALLREA